MFKKKKQPLGRSRSKVNSILNQPANFSSRNIDNDIDEKDSVEVDSVKMDSNEENDKNIQMLIALKTIVAPDRIEFIDRIIKLYKDDIVEENLNKNE